MYILVVIRMQGPNPHPDQSRLGEGRQSPTGLVCSDGIGATATELSER